MMMDGTGMMSMMIFMLLFGLLSIVLVVLIVVGVVKWFSGSKLPFSAKERDNPLEILRTRYAKGEIDRETFEAVRRDIEK